MCARAGTKRGGSQTPNSTPPPNRGPGGPCDPTQPMALPLGLTRPRVRSPVGYAMCNDGSAPLVCERAANTTNKKNKNKTSEKGTKRPADKHPKKGLRESPRNPKTPWGQETHPKNARRTHGRNGREMTAARGTKNKKKPKRARGGGVSC